MRDLRRHICFEEELRCPALHEPGPVPPLLVMRREHGDLWATMDALATGLASGLEGSHVKDLVDRLTSQLHGHNAKEEAIVYPASDQTIAALPAETARSYARFVVKRRVRERRERGGKVRHLDARPAAGLDRRREGLLRR